MTCLSAVSRWGPNGQSHKAPLWMGGGQGLGLRGKTGTQKPLKYIWTTIRKEGMVSLSVYRKIREHWHSPYHQHTLCRKHTSRF